MKRRKFRSVSLPQGFTLVEVLIALAIAALGFGVVLHSVGLQMSLISGSVNRHQMLMHASEVLETSLSKGKLGEESVDVPIEETKFNTNQDEFQPIRYVYSLNSQPVTADPRVQQVSVLVKHSGSQIRLSAYRLRVKRD